MPSTRGSRMEETLREEGAVNGLGLGNPPEFSMEHTFRRIQPNYSQFYAALLGAAHHVSTRGLAGSRNPVVPFLSCCVSSLRSSSLASHRARLPYWHSGIGMRTREPCGRCPRMATTSFPNSLSYPSNFEDSIGSIERWDVCSCRKLIHFIRVVPSRDFACMDCPGSWCAK